MTLPATFQGYPRSVGRAGIRNNLLILSVCGLNAPQARKVSAALPEAVLVSSPHGRGQVGADRTFHDTMLRAIAAHPNVGAVLVLAPDAGLRAIFQDHASESGRLAAGISLQEAKEDSAVLVNQALGFGRALSARLAMDDRQACPVSDLALALECGHSDASSGLVANPLAGELADAVIAAGGAAVLSETLEWLGTEPSLYARCVSSDVADRLKALVAARHKIAQTAGKDLRIGNPGPQNHAGGITTLEEKSLGAVRKGGTSRIAGALGEGDRLPGPGLYLMDTPTLSPESITSMVASGAQIVCFTTGQGNPYGSAIAPTLKLTANPETAARLPDQIDFDASAGMKGRGAVLLPGLIETFRRICEGEPTASERARETDEVISRLGPSV